jgi:hypothetical protein
VLRQAFVVPRQALLILWQELLVLLSQVLSLWSFQFSTGKRVCGSVIPIPT